MPGQRVPHVDKFVLALSFGGPEHRLTIELAPYGPLAEAAELAGRNATTTAAHANLQRYWDNKRAAFDFSDRAAAGGR
eukprot:6768195-Alexandrium_andersonii.AAC.1